MSKTRGVVAGGHQKTVEAAAEMLLLGGNAFDGAIAAMLASFVVESVFTSVGGSGFLLSHTKEGKNLLYDFFSQTPQQKKPTSQVDFYPVNLHFGGAIQEFHIGLGSVAVPGNVAGIFKVHQDLGKLPFKEVIQPAIALAKNGFEINKFHQIASQILGGILLNTKEAREIYAPTGKLLLKGEICYLPELADTLTLLAEKGPQEFYQGEIAQQIIKDCQQKGGYLTEKDLKDYQVIIREPLKINYQGYDIITNPPPSSGGTLIAFALKYLENNLSNCEFGSKQHLETLAKAMAITNQARELEYDAYIYQEGIAKQFLSQENINKWGSTTHISVMDGEGNAASVTTTNGEGSSYIIPGRAVMLNNMLGEADLNPMGFHNWLCNQRLSSMMAPTIVLKEGKPMIVLGSAGSNRIRTAIIQVISNIIDFHFSLEQAVNNPRVHWENYIFNLEPPLKVDNLKLPGNSESVLWQEKSFYFGGVHAVGKNEKEEMEGAGDRRREGAFRLCD